MPRERSWTFCKSAMSVKLLFSGYKTARCTETIISDNTERGSLKLTRCSCRKKVHETENLSARNAEIQSKTYVWAEVFFFLTCDQAFYVFFLQFAAGSILWQFKVLGNPLYTLTKRLLGNLTDLQVVFGFCLAFKSGLESVCINFAPKHRSIQQLCCSPVRSYKKH